MFRRIPGFFFVIAALVLGFWAGPALAAPAKPNIVLITLESMRADWMGFLGSKARLTPNLDAIAAQSMIFEQAYAQAPLTVTSHATILSGTYPQTHGATEFGNPLSSSLPFLPDALRVNGYHTAAFAGSWELDARDGPALGFDRGFETYERNELLAGLVAQGSAWSTRGAKTPFFLWVNLDGTRVSPSYDSEVTNLDAAVGKLIATLRSQKLYDDALLIIVADHGEGLGAHAEDSHGIFLYDETVHVPLLLKLPKGHNAGRRVRNRVRLVDIAPTVLAIAGVPIPPQMQGQSLLRIATAMSDQPVYSRTDLPRSAFGWSAIESWRAGKYLYVRAPKHELYDLVADPGAKRNLAQSSKATLDTMASQLAAFDKRFTAAGDSSGGQLSSSEMQKLASLGYVGMQKTVQPAAAASGTDPKDGISSANKVLAAYAFLRHSKPDAALSTLQPALPDLPGSYLAQYVTGAALARQKNYAQALPYLHKAITQQPESVFANYAMGMGLLQTGDYKTAAVHLEIAAARLPKFAGVHLLLAQAYDHLGREEDAKRERLTLGELNGQKN